MRENTLRYILAGYYFLFLISAAVLGVFGGYNNYIYQNNYHMISTIFYIIGILALLACVLTVFVFFFGCFGAINRSSCLTITFIILLCFVILSQLSVAIAGFFFKSEMHTLNSKYFLDSLRMYKSQVGMADVWDNVQIKWDCCGAAHYKDWKIVFENDNLPISCCRTNGTAGGISCTQFSTNLRRQGCLNYFGAHLEDIVTIIASLGVGFTFLQFLGIGINCYAAKIFRRFDVYR